MVTISTSPLGTFGSYKPPVHKKSHFKYVFFVVFLVIILGAAYLVFYQGISLTNLTLTPTFMSAPPLSSLDSKIERLPNFQFNVFDSDLYKSLKIYGFVPVVADSLGRTNPFVPY